jgi:hypothetical protein
MLVVLQSYGTLFNSNDFSKINFRYGAISSAASRSIIHEIVSGPLALLIFRSKPVNYRPISLTSVTCKIMEHIIFKHIMKHLETHNILQLIITVEEISRYLDNKQQVDMLILNFSKALTPCLTPDSSEIIPLRNER